MKIIVPDDYALFRCIAGDCRHSCCIGWEIDIDHETRRNYRALKGPVGEKMKTAVKDTPEGAHFVLEKDGRCPFLNADGLCEIILQEGESALCQICADHPRFRNELSDRTEMGLGLCCEAAARQTLTRISPMQWTVLEDDGAMEETPEDEQALICLRDELIRRLQDRSLPLSLRMDELQARCGFEDSFTMKDWAQFLLTLERLDSVWDARLKSVPEESLPLSETWDVPLEQLLCLLMYRHVPGALEDGLLPERICLCLMLTQLVREIFAASPQQDMDTLTDVVRMTSSEIEYSDENVGAILQRMVLQD